MAPPMAIPEEQIEEKHCWELLRSSNVGRLVVVIGRDAELFLVNHLVNDGMIVLRTAAYSRLATALRSGGALFEADGVSGDGTSMWCVTVRGRVESVQNPNEIVGLLTLPLPSWYPDQEPWFLLVVPHRITGRRLSVRGTPSAGED